MRRVDRTYWLGVWVGAAGTVAAVLTVVGFAVAPAFIALYAPFEEAYAPLTRLATALTWRIAAPGSVAALLLWAHHDPDFGWRWAVLATAAGLIALLISVAGLLLPLWPLCRSVT